MLHIRWHVKEEMKQLILLKSLLFLGYLVFGAQNKTQILAVSSLPHTIRSAQKLTRPDNQIELPEKKNQDKNNNFEWKIYGMSYTYIQSNLDYPDLDYPDFSIIRTFSLVPFFSWILIRFDLKSFQR